MNNTDILTAIIRKAWEQGGYNENSYPVTRKSAYEIIFSVEFAKAFFITSDKGEIYTKEEEESYWRKMQQRTLKEVQDGRDPIKYLEKWL